MRQSQCLKTPGGAVFRNRKYEYNNYSETRIPAINKTQKDT